MSHSRQTEHYELPLYDGGDIINPLTDFNNANSSIDEALYNANQRSVGAETTANEAKDIAEGYDTRVSQATQTANDAMTLANNTQDMIADEFNPNKEGGYNVGDFVIYNGVLYRFINAHTGAWDASDVQTSPVLIEAIADVVDEGKQDIADAVADAEQEIAGQTEKVTKTQAMIAQPFDANKSGGYAVGDVVTYADKLYKFTSAHSGAWTGLDVEQVSVEEEIAKQTENVTNTQGMIAQPFDENKVDGYAVNDVVIYDNKLYKFTSTHSGAWTGLDVEQTDIVDVLNKLSHVGMIIHSTTLDTEAKVKAIYGSNTSWLQHSGYMLRGATNGVTANNNTFNSANGFGGEDAHTLTLNEIPSHTHGGIPQETSNAANGDATDDRYRLYWANSVASRDSAAAGGGQAHNNIPKYKSVYIWERIA